MTEAERDEVVCPGVEGTNLAAIALAALRGRGWDRPPLRIEIEKRIPVAAGLGGGSADAAAVLRLAAARSRASRSWRPALGADVPSQLDPGLALVSGAGERVEPLAAPGEHAFVLIPVDEGLSTAEVYAEADRLGLGRDGAEIEQSRGRLREAAGSAPHRSTIPSCSSTTSSARRSRCGRRSPGRSTRSRRPGPQRALVTGSGPTAFGLFADIVAADRAAAALPPRYAAAIVTGPDSFR